MIGSKVTLSLAAAALIASGTLAFAQTMRSGEGTTGSPTESSDVNGNRTLSGKSATGANRMSTGTGTDAGAGATHGTATGGPVGGNPNRN